MHWFIKTLLRLPTLQPFPAFLGIGSFSYVPNVPFTLPQFNHACATPLTTLLLDSEYLLSVAPPAQKEAIARVHQCSKRLQALFSFSRQEDFFDISELVEELVVAYRAPITLSAEKPLLIKGSRILFSEVVSCLITNAVESYPESKDQQVIIAAKNTLDGVVVKITDFGCGMSWFELFLARFASITSKEQGSGIGIRFCTRILKQYFRGTLTFISTKQVGTTAVVTIPHQR